MPLESSLTYQYRFAWLYSTLQVGIAMDWQEYVIPGTLLVDYGPVGKQAFADVSIFCSKESFLDWDAIFFVRAYGSHL